MTTLTPEQYPAYAPACINRHAPEHAETLAQAMGLAAYEGHDTNENVKHKRVPRLRIPESRQAVEADPSTVGRVVRTTGRVLARRLA